MPTTIPSRANHPTVSVCIPLYNGERYLRECVDSVLAQTYQDFEIVFVDDVSRDGSVAIAEEYAAKDSRIRVARNTANVGLSGNCNRCLELAAGEWIKFVFQDDAIGPDCIEKMLRRASRDVPFVSCQRALVFDDTVSRERRVWYEEHRALVARLFSEWGMFATAEQCRRLAIEYFETNVFGEATSVLMHRRVFDAVGVFNPALIMICDLEMWARITIRFGAALIAEDLATFRAHGGSATAANAKRHYRAKTLDPAIILHQFARDPAYESLRDYAASMSPRAGIDEAFDWASHDALWTANEAARDAASPTSALLDELRALTVAYPAIRRGAASHFAWRLRRKIFGLAEPRLLAERRRVGA